MLHAVFKHVSNKTPAKIKKLFPKLWFRVMHRKRDKAQLLQ